MGARHARLRPFFRSPPVDNPGITPRLVWSRSPNPASRITDIVAASTGDSRADQSALLIWCAPAEMHPTNRSRRSDPCRRHICRWLPPARNGGSDRFRPNGSIASKAAMRDLRTQGLDRVRAALAAQRHVSRRLAPASPPWRSQTGTDMKPFRRSRDTIRKQTAVRKEAHRRRQSPSGGPHEPFHSLC